MKINSFLWDNYLKTSGESIIKAFEYLLNLNDLAKNYSYIIKEFKNLSCSFDEFTTNIKQCVPVFKRNIKKFCVQSPYKEHTIQNEMNNFYKILSNNNFIKPSDTFDRFIRYIDCYTLGLSVKMPELFVPWFFQCSFNIFQEICDYFNIAIDFSKLPSKSDYKGRFMYYGELCIELQEFRKENNFTLAELCAFLYDYAPKVVLAEKISVEKITTEPRNAYLIGTKDNKWFFSTLDSDTISFWQANPDTQVGDALVMYVCSPISQIKYIWRAITPGFIDPFFWYYRCTYVSNPIKIEGMTIKELKTDPVTKDEPIVRKNMQGLNGTPIRPSVYNHILDICKTDDKEKLPYIKYALELKTDKEINNERDVEVMLLEPMLEKLGYKKEHWCRQMVTKMGRKEREIPDYVIFPVYTPGKERGKIVLEAKHTIPNKKQLEDDRRQAASYGKALLSEYVVLVSKDDIYLYSKEDHFDDYIFKCSWTELNEDKDCFNKLYKYIGYKNKK